MAKKTVTQVKGKPKLSKKIESEIDTSSTTNFSWRTFLGTLAANVVADQINRGVLVENLAKIGKGALDVFLNSVAQEISKDRPNNNQLLAQIRDHYRGGRLVLVLGAGVSMTQGIPSWNNLLREILISIITPDKTEVTAENRLIVNSMISLFPSNPLIAARYLSLHFEKNEQDDPLAFAKEIQKHIYKKLVVAQDDKLIKIIRDLCIAPGKSPNLDSVITYNYDDLLETAIEELGTGVRYRSVYELGSNPTPEELAIFHVHGFIPKDRSLDQSNKVTLSEDIYHKQYSDVYGWNNLVQINKFKDCNCLFVGMSFTDPNLRRLLDIARLQRGDNKIHHYCFRKRYETDEIKAAIEAALSKNKSDAEIPLDDISNSIERLTQLIEDFETTDAESFGVSLLWVDDYDEIHELLAKIRVP